MLALAWPVRARAQQASQLRRIGVLLPYSENDSEAKSHLAVFTQELNRLGWSQGHNIRIDPRYAAGMADQYAVLARELTALQPDVILSESTTSRRRRSLSSFQRGSGSATAPTGSANSPMPAVFPR